MRKKGNWVWIIHFLCYLMVVTINITYFFTPNSSVNTYHTILIAFDFGFSLGYLLNALAVILTTISIVPFYCYIFKHQILSQNFWKWFLLARIAAEITGRPYEISVIKSMFYHDQMVGFNLALLAFFLLLPSYIALFAYAFKRAPQAR